MKSWSRLLLDSECWQLVTVGAEINRRLISSMEILTFFVILKRKKSAEFCMDEMFGIISGNSCSFLCLLQLKVQQGYQLFLISEPLNLCKSLISHLRHAITPPQDQNNGRAEACICRIDCTRLCISFPCNCLTFCH